MATIMPYTIVDTGTITGPDVYLGYEANAQMICLALNAAYRHGRASLMPLVDALNEIANFGFGYCECKGRCYCDKNHLQFLARCAIYKMNGWPKPVNHLAKSMHVEGKESQ